MSLCRPAPPQAKFSTYKQDRDLHFVHCTGNGLDCDLAFGSATPKFVPVPMGRGPVRLPIGGGAQIRRGIAGDHLVGCFCPVRAGLSERAAAEG
jgi:hypothetical protein